MADDFELPDQSLLRDPLGETARREGRALLAVSLLAIAVVKGHMMPAKLVMADIELTADNQRFILTVLFWVVVYFVVAFVSYALSDYGLWGFDFRAARFANRQMALEGLRRALQPTGDTAPQARHSMPYPIMGSVGAGDPPPLPPDVQAAQRTGPRVKSPSFFTKHRTRFTQFAFLVRLTIDLVLPVAIGFWALWLLWYATPAVTPLRAYSIWLGPPSHP